MNGVRLSFPRHAGGIRSIGNAFPIPYRMDSRLRGNDYIWGWIMLIVHVHVRVKPECIDTFKETTIANARQSIQEPGIARFDVIQQNDDPTRFVLVEVYRNAEATVAHKATAHYATWRDRMESLMAEPRSSVKYSSVFPAE